MWKRLAIWIAAILALAAAAIALISFGGEQLLSESWIARYDSPAHGQDEARVLALDRDGNLYVAGYTEGDTSDDYTTVKYDSEGNLLWAVHYNGPAGGTDRVYAMTVDSLGNVLITGESQGEDTSYDYATVKYDSDGNELWVARYNGPASGSDGANSIAVDDLGNVFVTGYSTGNGSDYATVKYDSDGNQLWTARYDGPRGSADYASALALDASDNVYVTGYSLGDTTSFDFATVKYGTGGNQIWVSRYNGTADLDDEPRAIAVDVSGNVWVTGYSENGVDSTDFATIRYNSDGDQLWVSRYNIREGGQARANDIALDAEGNAYVTGSSLFPVRDYVTSDAVTVKYDSQGNELWGARYNGPEKLDDGANAVVVDHEGNAYITGSSAGISSYADCITVKYDRGGSRAWVARYNGPRSGADFARDIVVDGEGTVYISGYSYGNDTLRDYVTIKYSQ